MTKRHDHDWDEKQQPESVPVAEGMVRVKCIVSNRPWTDTKALDKDEEADVPEALAKLMEDNKQVERVK